MDFSGKTALVTGAAGAIGKGIAKELCNAGARVFITDLKQEAVNVALKDVYSDGTCLGLAADVTKEKQVKAVVDEASKAFDGRIDILVNVAGIIGSCPVEEMTEQVWDNMFAV
ncbi:MAG: SDR family NAD(P)-dependent oxidoreductase, partial [Planctomycetota bacterium]